MNHRFYKHRAYCGTSAKIKTNTIFYVPFNFETLGRLMRPDFNVNEIF
jgi:hypothetical protein